MWSYTRALAWLEGIYSYIGTDLHEHPVEMYSMSMNTHITSWYHVHSNNPHLPSNMHIVWYVTQNRSQALP